MLLALALLAGLAAVAYAATPRGGGSHGDGGRRPGAPRAWRAAIYRHPDRLSLSTDARLEFGAGRRAQRFQCRLDGSGWKACRTPLSLTALKPGRHSFAVRALDRRDRPSAAAGFRWRVLEPKNFAIVPPARIGALYPGAPATPLAVTIENPNPVPIFVTELRVSATDDPPGCASAENLSLLPAGLSKAAPLRVPAGGSASLPAPGASAPSIQLRNLPVNQDACQNARFPLAFSGKARG